MEEENVDDLLTDEPAVKSRPTSSGLRSRPGSGPTPSSRPGSRPESRTGSARYG
jgi:hypothetical protein